MDGHPVFDIMARSTKKLIEDKIKKTRTEAGEVSVNERHRARAVMYLAALGLSRKEIADKLDMPSSSVGGFLKSESIQRGIEKIQYDLFLKDPQKIFLNIAPKAINVARKIMLDETAKDNTRLDAAFKFLDRAFGKPTQHIEHGTGLIKDVLTAIVKGDDKAKVVDIEDAEVVESKDKEDADKWINENIEKL